MRALTFFLMISMCLVACGGDPQDNADANATDSAIDNSDTETENPGSTEADEPNEDSGQDTDGLVEPDNSQTQPLDTGLWDFTVEQEVEGELIEREIIVHVPVTLDANRLYPMVFAFHGNGGIADHFIGELGAFVEDGEFVGVYLQGVENSWNMGREESKADDTAFVNQVVDYLKQYQSLDFERVYGYGFSNGSGIIHKIAVESSVFRAIAGFASQLLEGAGPTDNSGPVSVFQMHDVGDGVIPYDGGLSNATGHTFYSAEQSAALWAAHNQCGEDPSLMDLDGGHTKFTYDGCANNTEVVHYKTVGAGHGTPDDLDGAPSQVAWDFLKRQR